MSEAPDQSGGPPTSDDSAAFLRKLLLSGPNKHQAVLAGASVLDAILHHVAHPHDGEDKLLRELQIAVSTTEAGEDPVSPAGASEEPERTARAHIWTCESLNGLDLEALEVQAQLVEWFDIGLQLIADARSRVYLAIAALACGVFDSEEELEVMDFVIRMTAAKIL
ncbi:hypothetical protein ACG7TL_003386 [Trametes sanguinea]